MGKHVNQLKVAELNSKFFALQQAHLRMGNLQFFLDFSELLKNHQSKKDFHTWHVESMTKYKNIILSEDFIRYAKNFSNTVSFSLDFFLGKSLKEVNWEEVLKYRHEKFALSEEKAWMMFYALVVEPNIGEDLLGASVKDFQTRFVSFKRKNSVLTEENLIMRIENLSPVITVDILNDLPKNKDFEKERLFNLIEE